MRIPGGRHSKPDEAQRSRKRGPPSQPNPRTQEPASCGERPTNSWRSVLGSVVLDSGRSLLHEQQQAASEAPGLLGPAVLDSGRSLHKQPMASELGILLGSALGSGRSLHEQQPVASESGTLLGSGRSVHQHQPVTLELGAVLDSAVPGSKLAIQISNRWLWNQAC